MLTHTFNVLSQSPYGLSTVLPPHKHSYVVYVCVVVSKFYLFAPALQLTAYETAWACMCAFFCLFINS